MMQLSTDLEVLKEIPGYKAILKSVLKSQIQLLIEQLSEHTGEESIILTASVHDGSLSHLGSGTGKGFLEGREEIKSQFLGYCLKTHHKQKAVEARTPYQRTHLGPRKSLQQQQLNKRPKLHSGLVQTISPGESANITSFLETPVLSCSQESNISGFPLLSSDSTVNLKAEVQETPSFESSGYHAVTSASDEILSVSMTSTASIPSSVHLTHTQTSHAARINSDQADSTIETRESEHHSESVIVKTEPNVNEEEDLEITGVEMGSVSLGNLSMDSWSQGQMGYSSEGDNSISQGDQSGYNSGGDQTSSRAPRFEPYYPAGIDIPVFPCPVCGKVFSLKGNLKKHFLIHTGERPFVCVHCYKSFRQKITLKHHVKVMHWQHNQWTDNLARPYGNITQNQSGKAFGNIE